MLRLRLWLRPALDPRLSATTTFCRRRALLRRLRCDAILRRLRRNTIGLRRSTTSLGAARALDLRLRAAALNLGTSLRLAAASRPPEILRPSTATEFAPGLPCIAAAFRRGRRAFAPTEIRLRLLGLLLLAEILPSNLRLPFIAAATLRAKRRLLAAAKIRLLLRLALLRAEVLAQLAWTLFSAAALRAQGRL